jgi:hypothetical protein
MSFDHDDLGIDLDRVAVLPECMACRKKSDGCAVIIEFHEGAETKTILCGKHYDEWTNRRRLGDTITARAFAASLREGRFRPCWEAKMDD